MTNIQLSMSIGIPTLVIILTALDTRRNIRRTFGKLDHLTESLCMEMKALREDFSKDMAALRQAMRDDMNQFHGRMTDFGTNL